MQVSGVPDIATIVIADEFSRTPGGRHMKDGPHSGQRLREELLAPALHKYERLVVDLDGTDALPGEFIDEAFGGLVRACGYIPEDLRKRLELKSENDPSLIAAVWDSVEDSRPVPGTE